MISCICSHLYLLLWHYYCYSLMMTLIVWNLILSYIELCIWVFFFPRIPHKFGRGSKHFKKACFFKFPTSISDNMSPSKGFFCGGGYINFRSIRCYSLCQLAMNPLLLSNLFTCSWGQGEVYRSMLTTFAEPIKWLCKAVKIPNWFELMMGHVIWRRCDGPSSSKSIIRRKKNRCFLMPINVS